METHQKVAAAILVLVVVFLGGMLFERANPCARSQPTLTD